MISGLIPQRFDALGNDGGSYFISQDDDSNTLWWYAEDPDLDWANVFGGRLRSVNGVDRWVGRFIDVPKGRFCGHGELACETRSSQASPRLISIDSARYGGETIRQPAPGEIVRASDPARQLPGFVGEGLENISGLWRGIEDGGSYYIREVSGTNMIAWMGENPTAQPWEDEDSQGASFTNVMMGLRRGRLIEATWSDIPRGRINSAGTLGLEIVDENLIRVVSETGRFFNRTFRRVPQFSLQLTFTTLTITDQNEHILEGDEPYFLALIAMMDGNVANLSTRDFDPDFSNSFVLPKLGDNLDVGTYLITPTRMINIPFKPTPGDRGNHPILGIALRGGEQDWSSPNWRTNQLREWISGAESRISRRFFRREDINFATDARVWHNEWTWRDEDDIFGYAARSFTFRQLENLAGRPPLPMTFILVGGDVRYVVRATLSVSGARSNCQP